MVVRVAPEDHGKMITYGDCVEYGDDTAEQKRLYETIVRGSKEEIGRSCSDGHLTATTYVKDGMTALHIVAAVGRRDAVPVIELLLQSGFHVDTQTKATDDTALHLVVGRADMEEAFPVVLKLLEYKPDLHLRNRKLRTPYDLAVGRGHYELAETLDGHLTPSEAKEFYKGQLGEMYGAKLLEAVIASDEAAIHECIERGADPNFVNKYKNGAIHYSATHCRLAPLRTLQSLVTAGADVNIQDDEGDTALNLVVKSRRLRETGDMYMCAELLVQNGALSTYRDLDGNDALALAEKKDYTDIVRLLRGARGQHVQVRPPPTLQSLPPLPTVRVSQDDDDDDDDEPFVHPPPQPPPEPQSSVRRPRLHSPISEHDEYNADGETTLMNAVKFGDENEVTYALFELAGDPAVPDDQGVFPLHHAVIRDDLDPEARHAVIGALLEAGADVNAVTQSTGSTALHIAATRDLPDTVSQLLEARDCDCDLQDQQGQTAYDCANEAGNQEVMDILTNHMPPPPPATPPPRNAPKKKNSSFTCTVS